MKHLLITILVIFSFSAFAADNEKIDVEKIEKKYWQADDQNYNVVQSRTYTRANKFMISLGAGPMLMEQYSDGFNFNLGLTYNFTDTWGIEASYNSASLSDNDLQKQIQEKGITLGGTAANLYGNHGKYISYTGVTGWLTPLYAKMSFFGKNIIYFDLSFGLNLGMTEYEQQIQAGNNSESVFSYGLNLSQNFYLTKHFSIRADYVWRFHNQEIIDYFTGLKSEDDLVINSFFNLGFSYIF